MPRTVITDDTPWDLLSSKAMDVTIAKHPDGYRIWVHDAEKGLLVRAYRISSMVLDMDEEARAALRWKRP